ncbi:MAG: outer membrane protein assembly factor BamA [Nitrospiria bacterium]
MKRTFGFLPFLILILSIIPFASVSADESSPFGKVIQKITLTSSEETLQDTHYEELKKKLPIEVGNRLTSQLIRECLTILYKTGEFSNIAVSAQDVPEGIVLNFTLYKRLRIAEFHWKGNKGFLSNFLQDFLKLKINNELVLGWEKEVEKRLESFYRDRGYFNAKIKIITSPLKVPSRLRVDFIIDEGDQFTLGKIYFTGNTGFDEKTLLETLRIYPGFYYSKNSIQTYINPLFDLYHRKRYLNVKIKEPILHFKSSNQVDLEIPVDAGPQIFVYLKFKGPRNYLYSTLIKQISVDDEKSVDQSVLDDSAKRLADFYHNEGYPLVEVRSEPQVLSNGKILNAFFYVTEGPRVVITDLNFKGNASLPDELLRNSISHQKTDFWVPKYLRTPAIQDDLQSLTELYRTKGFLLTDVKDTIRYSNDKKTGAIDFNIIEGIRTLIQQVKFEGISPAHLPEIQKIVQSQKGGYYYNGTVLQDKFAISAYYRKKGYADVTVEASVIFKDNEKKDLAEINFKVDEGSLIKIGHIQLSGNSYTRANVILREVDFKQGDYYQEELILKSQRKIARLGYFQSVRIHPINVEEEDINRDVEIQVKERNAGAVEFGGGYADVEGLNGFAELSHKNIAGTGRTASARTEISQIGNREILSYTEPWIFNFPLNARSTAFYESIYNPNIDYTLKSIGGTVGVDKSIWDHYKLSLTYQYENDRYIDVPPAAKLAPEDYNDANISSINPSIVRDTRDDFLNPGKGSINAIWLRWAAQFMGGDTQEVKISLQSSWYYSLGDRITVAFSSRGGIAYNFGETTSVPISERFTLGGRSTVRGYPENMLGTLDQTIDRATLTPLGGESMVVFNGELRYNFPKSFGFVLFFDSGNVWESYNEAWSSPLKSSVGPGLRYNTPVGPLRIDLGFKLNREYWESASEFHFALGHAF